MVGNATVGTGLNAYLVTKLIVGAGYATAGAMIGICLQKSTFLWTFIFTYIAVGAIVGFGANPLPYGTFAALIAYRVAGWQKRRRLILQSSVPAAKRATAM
jgi:hypothetical protein